MPNPHEYSTPAIQIPTCFKSTVAGAANSNHAYQRSMYSAAEQRNSLLKRAYDVISNLQTDVDGLVEEVSIASEASPSSPISPLQQGSSPHALSPQQTGDGLVDIMRTAAATSAAAARLRSRAEQAQRQAQEAEDSQSHAAEEEAKAERLADQAERRAMQEQDKGNLAAAVAASSTASRLRKAAAKLQTAAKEEEQAQLLQAAWAQLQAATAAAQHSEEKQSAAAQASQQAQRAAAEVGEKHRAATKAQAQAEKLQSQVAKLKVAGRAEEAKRAQQQAKKWLQTALQAAQAVEAAEQQEKAASEVAQAAAAASFEAEAQAEKLTGVVKQLQEATEAGVLAATWRKKATEAAQKAIDVHELAQQHAAQAGAAGSRAAAAEDQAQQFEAQGKFADAAAAALQADRWHKAAGDAAKQAAKLQAEAKAAAAQCDAASATAEEAKSLARRLDIKTGHLRRSASSVPEQMSRRQTDSQTDLQSQSKGASMPSAAAKLHSALPTRGQSLRPTGMSASPSRLSRMTIQDPLDNEEMDESPRGSADGAKDHLGQLSRGTSSVAAQAERDAAKAADDAMGGAQKPPKKAYATQQEEMDAELEAAMAADAAAAGTDTQDSPQAALGYSASPGGSPEGRNGPRLELPGDGGGIDFDALDLAAPQDVSAGGYPQQDANRAKLEEAVQKWQTSARKAQRYADACYAEAQAKADEAAEATAQAATAQQEAEKLAESGRHNDAEAATAAAQRWSRRAAKAQQEGDAARSEGDTKVEEAKEAATQAAQAQQEMQLAGAARSSPLQVPLTTEQPQAIQALPDSESNGNASGLMQEAAEAVQQAELAQKEAQQLQEAGYFAEAAALSTTAHKWRKKAAKANRAVERARAESSFVSGIVPGSPRAGLSAESSRTEGLADSFARGLFGDSPRADSSARSPRKGPTGDSPRRGAFTDSLHLGLASDSPRPGQVDTSPGGRGRTVPDWLSSPRSSSAGSKRRTPDSSFGGGPLGSPLGRHPHTASESTSPGAIHRTNVFSYPESRRVSSEGSAEAVPQAVHGHQPEKSTREGLAVAGQAKAASQLSLPEARAGTSDMLEEAARWAKRNAKALKLARHAKEAAAASEQEAAAAAEEAERAARQAEQGVANDSALALKQAAAKWTKRAGKAQRAAARARAEAEAQEAEAAQAAHLAQQATESHAQAEAQAQAQAAARDAETAAQAAARDAEATSETAAKARQQADSFEAEVSDAAGQAADAWALVEAMEAKGDAAAAADKAAQAVALQQEYQERQAAADAAASQAQQQELAAISLRSAATAALQAARAASSQQQQQQQQLRQELNLPWNNDNQADSLGLQQQQQQQQVQSLEVPVPHNQSSDAGGSAEGGLKGAVESASEGQDEAAKAAYQQWSASFEARMSGKSAQRTVGPYTATQQQLRDLTSQSSLPGKAALVTWESFKSMAKPGDRLRLAASSQAEKLLVLAEVRDQEAMGSTRRAIELQQLAAGSGSLLEASQLAAAAQRHSEQAQTASQMAQLARAEAERLDGESPSGMQLHLMHQLEGLERSVRRVEQQVSSTKQTRRRRKAVSLPAQGAEEGSSVIPYLDGLPLEYWVVPPRTPMIALPSVAANLPGPQRSVTVPSTSSAFKYGTAHSMSRQSLNATRYSAGATLTGRHWCYSSSLPRTRLPMSAYATPQQPSQPHTQPKENQQWGSSKGALPSPRALPNSPPLQSVNKVLGHNRL
ncbi:hypothetical protein WJX79_001187 [Trebouxia sp. C0005]